jgi:hypothetical protein
MRLLNGVYTQRFNRRHTRVGHLFQGRFTGIVVEQLSHLLELARYVVLNPVRAGMVGAPEDYRWSSLRATLGLSPLPPWLAAERLLEPFNSPARYLEFVREGAGLPSPWSALRGSVPGWMLSLAPTRRRAVGAFGRPRCRGGNVWRGDRAWSSCSWPPAGIVAICFVSLQKCADSRPDPVR